ncbi:hypothetical protein [Rhizobium hidalgonense]|uniref:hypothetical protein n=1 Tax=Rhizobium hidalgonense TaxID=1538159 RepID=UPI0011072EF9|nr:hypothetical protein [Rhizobium hidalgonense]QKK27503.1 hypothetical protein FFM81_029675 [Rhizobium hidalgonense]
MSFLFDLAKEYIRAKLFSPKDFFERQKRNLIRTIIVPLIVLFGAPSAIVAFVTSLQLFELKTSGLLIRLVGNASDDLLYLTGGIVVTLCFSLGLNLIYGMRLKSIELELAQMETVTTQLSATQVLHQKYDQFILEGKVQEALSIGAYISKTNPEYLTRNPSLVIDMVERGARVELADLRPSPLRLSGPEADGETKTR